MVEALAAKRLADNERKKAARKAKKDSNKSLEILQSNREQHKFARSAENEDPDYRSQRLQKEFDRTQYLKESETLEDKNERLQKDRERHVFERSSDNEDPVHLSQRLKRNLELHALIRSAQN